MRIQSNDIVLLDTTDSKKIDLHITSNHPTVQIYDQNTSQGTLTPDWSTNPLELTPIVYVDSTDVTNELTSFIWTKIKGSETSEEQISTSKILRISSNDLDESATIRYKCAVVYNGKSFSNEITFARVNTGKNGTNGNNAPAVKAQYSINGTSNWATALDSSVHKYIRFSYDNGATWTSAIKISGEDGKSVEIKGVAYAKTTPVTGQTIVLYSDTGTTIQITNAVDGDSYLVNGYLCVYNGTNFVCVGQIQGPKGDQGDSYYLFIRYADNANGGGISTSPSGKTYIGFYRSSVNQVPTDVSATTWNWSKFVGDNAKSINLTASAQVFKVDKSNTISPTTITVTAQAVNTSVSAWTYSTDGGKTFASALPEGVTRSGNVVTLTGTSVTANSIVVKASDGTYNDVLTIYKAIDGIDGGIGPDGKPAPIVFLSNENMSFVANSSGQAASTTVYCNVVAYNGTTKVTPELGTITGLPTGMSVTAANITTVSNEKVIPIVIANNATLGSANSISGAINIPIISPVATTLKLNWSKINTGAKGEAGVGINSVTVTYGTSASASTQPTSWQATVPAVAEGSYLWTRTVIDYTDDAIADTVTYTYAKQGVNGSIGTSVTVSSIQYQASTSATTAPTGTWSNTVVSVAEGSYLWTKTTFSDGKIAYGVAKQGTSGAPGTPASLVNITPSAMYFKSTTGKDGTFTPEYIYLYPRFQNVVYGNWQYSVDGGVTWASVSGANGLAVSTYNSIANTLRISRTSTLYTDTVTSISFRCNSATSGVYDTVSIVKIYDVVDLQIGGRNLLLQTDSTEKSTTISNTNGYGVISQFVPSTKTWKAGYVDIAEYGLSIGDTLTFQAYLVPQNNLPVAVRVWGSSNGTSGSPLMNGNFVSEPGVSSCTFTMTYQYLYLAVVTQALPSVSIIEKYSNCQLERGHKATDWIPAPEDIDTNIEKVNTTLTNSLVDVKTTANSAVSRVSETEKSITTINNNITSLTNKVSAAEQKITADAIVSTVTKSTTYTSDLGKKVNSTEIISKINQTAETITISASKIGILGATNIPDLTADKIKGGTLTLGGSSATTQNGQLLVKNASDVDMVKLNKDGLVVNSGHLLVSRDFENSRYNWEDESWTTTTNTSQLELADTYLRMGYYTSLGYSPNMVLSNEGLTFQGYGQGVGSWGSYIGHEWDQLNFVIQDTVRSSISFRGANDVEMANLNSYNFDIKVPTVFSGGISYIAIPSSANLNNYKTPGFYRCSLNATAATLTNCPTTYAFSLAVEEHAGVKQTLTVYLTSNQPIIYVRNFYDGAWGQWSRLCYAAENVTLWSGVAGVNTTLTLKENFRDFRYLTCIIGTTTEPFGIVLGSFLDNEVAELHFSASFTATSGKAGNNTYGAKFTVSSGTSIRLVGCGTIELANLSVRKIVGWR